MNVRPRWRFNKRCLAPLWGTFVLWAVIPAGALCAQSAASPPIIINEIHYQPPNKTKFEEFIELHNAGLEAVSLEGWRFDDGVQFTFPVATEIAAGGYLVVAGNPAAFGERFGFEPLGPWIGRLSNAGERIRLRDAGGNLIEEVNYAAGFPWPTDAAGGGMPKTTGYSVELIHPSLDRNHGGSWRNSLPPNLVPAASYVAANDPEWHYRKGTSEASTPVEAWRQREFAEDETWSIGRTSIGYGDIDDATILTDMYANYISVFLRRTFTIAPGQVPGDLRLRLRVDDGCIVWINGTEVARAHMNAGDFAFNATNAAQNHEASPTAFETIQLPNAAAYLVEGNNVLAIQVFNLTLTSGDLTIDGDLSAAQGTTSPTPGRRNSVFATNAPPFIRQVAHAPQQPGSGETVLVTAQVSDFQGVAGVSLHYQTVLPGRYIRITDPNYNSPTRWTIVAMNDAGQDGDAVAGDTVYSTTLPAALQVHRHLIRYRVQATDGSNPPLDITVPYADDGSPNFAYFVYDGIPAWSGASKPTGSNRTPVLHFPESVMGSLPAYHLIANADDVINSQFNSSFDSVRMRGTVIIEGEVYDHIEFHNRGANSTYVSGKNKWRVRATRARKFKLRDGYGRPYLLDWNDFNLEGCSSPWGAVNRGMAGVDEAVSFRAYQLAGVPAPNFHYLQFRVIDNAIEATANNQYEGDLWGLYLAKETPDGSFLDERGLPDGSVYKTENGRFEKKNQGMTHPESTEDWSTFLSNSRSRAANSSANTDWWRANLHLPTYYTGRALNRFLGNVDLREAANHYFYHHPDDRWHYIPWDLDLMFIPTLMNSGTIDQKNCLQMSPLRIEFRNRCREILDLLGADDSINGGQIGQLIDEYAQIVNPSGAALTWADVDECMWNWHPRSQGSGANSGFTSHKGNFYRTPFVDGRGGITWTRTLINAVNGYANHEAFVRFITDYTTDKYPVGRTWAINNGNPLGYGFKFVEHEARDSGVPRRPIITYGGTESFPANDLVFHSSAFQRNPSGGRVFAAMQWRVGEISAPGIPLYNPNEPRIYEIESVWTSPEMTPFVETTRIPFSAIRPGHTYRVRARHQDTNGRWSRWSAANQFVPSAPDVGVYKNNLVISEIMYNPPGDTVEEQAAGYGGEDFEFIQLMNVGAAPLDLTDVRFTKGIDFDFPIGFTLAPGASAYVARNQAAFNWRYGAGKTIAGAYEPDNLSNGGERIKLSYGAGTAIHEFTYGTAAPWPTIADGEGYSLQLIAPASRPDHALVASWRAGIDWASWSAARGGITNFLDDQDGDGLSALMEYGLGSNPNSPSTSAALTAALTDNHLTLTFRRQTRAADLSYDIEFSFDLKIWSGGAELVSSTANPDGTVTETWRSPVQLSGNHQFARLRVTLR